MSGAHISIDTAVALLQQAEQRGAFNCAKCGPRPSYEFSADPSGYYCDAVDERGAPLYHIAHEDNANA